MIELKIFDHLGAWNNFRSCCIDGTPVTISQALRSYSAKPIILEGVDGQVIFNRIAFSTEQDQLLWLLKWS